METVLNVVTNVTEPFNTIGLKQYNLAARFLKMSISSLGLPPDSAVPQPLQQGLLQAVYAVR